MALKALLCTTDPARARRVLTLPCLGRVTVERASEPGAAADAIAAGRHRLVLLEAGPIDDQVLKLCGTIRDAAPTHRFILVLLPPETIAGAELPTSRAGVDEVIALDQSDRALEERMFAVVERAARLENQSGLSAEAAATLQRAMDRMQLGVTISSLDGTIIYCNEADARMHGWPPDELIGQHVRVLSPPDRWNPLSVQEARGITSWRRESVNVRRDGAEFPVQLLSDVVLDSDGEPVAIVTVCEDLTERKRVESELGTAHDELSTRVRQRTTELLEANIRLQHEILERRKAERQLLYEALHDSLTNLPNRALFYDRLSRVLASAGRHHGQISAVFYLNLDQYKVVMESLGPEAGDRLLVQAAHRLRHCLRPEDTIGSAGGDEFLVLVEDLPDASDATRVARRIQEALAAPMEIAGHTVFTTASIGIALSTTGYEKAEDMIRDAQIAMFRAQTGSGGGHVVFDREMHNRAVARMQLEMQLRQALDQQEFHVHYQPIVDLASGSVKGFEALARWNTSEGVPIPPNEFIPLAEETGTIFDLENQILRRVCRDVAEWRQLVGDSVPYVSVNLSGKELANPAFAQQVGSVLNEFTIRPSTLRFEVTESAIIQNADVAADVLEELRELGVGVYIDDFGTGYSSLSSLHSYPIDTLKIDQSFVSGREGRPVNWEIVRVIIGLAENLGLEVIAEGIETAEQLVAIREMGCRYGQGFLFSRPVEPTEVQRFLASPKIPLEA
jgi:diguanylate cyclase (GGDEF)-like protein/PAS domain S-box-containing protein